VTKQKGETRQHPSRTMTKETDWLTERDGTEQKEHAGNTKNVREEMEN